MSSKIKVPIEAFPTAGIFTGPLVCLDSLVSNKKGAYIAVFPVHGAPLLGALFFYLLCLLLSLSLLEQNIIVIITALSNWFLKSNSGILRREANKHTKLCRVYDHFNFLRTQD